MKKIWILFAVLAFSIGQSAEYPLINAGKSAYVIVQSPDSIPAEDTAVQDLAHYLQWITQAEFSVLPEQQVTPEMRAIYVGQTDLARQSGVDFAALGPEEWVIRTTPNGNLILTGGRTRGTLYAVYEFLETVGGCRWFDEHNELIPINPELRIPALDERKQPYFRIRQIFDLLDWYPVSCAFKTKNKGQSYAGAEYGWDFRMGRPGQHHTLHRYSSAWPKDKTEWFSLNDKGERLVAINGVGPGQVCFTNPEVKAQMLSQLRQFIASDRSQAQAAGSPVPTLYDVSANDNEDKCVCSNCRALAEREGSYAAPLLELVNYLAENIRQEYPDIYLRTFAYMFSTEPAKNIRPADHVIMHIAVLGVEFGGSKRRDTMRALTHPNNRYTDQLIREWSRQGRVGIWDYWTLYSTDFASPYTNLDSIPENIRYYRDQNVIDAFIECENVPDISFFPLKRYLGYKLLANPDADEKVIIDEFMNGYYGETAAPFLQELQRYMAMRQEEIPEALASQYITKRDYLDVTFFQTALGLLEQAEATMQGDEKRIANIRRERIPILSALFLRWGQLPGAGEIFDQAGLLREFETESLKSLEYYHADLEPENFKSKFTAQLQKSVEKFRYSNIVVPIPEEFQAHDVIALPWYNFRLAGKAKFAADADAVGGQCAQLGEDAQGRTKDGNTDFGIYDENKRNVIASRIIRDTDIPQDEKYHLTKIGEAHFVSPLASFYAGASWEIQCDLMPVVREGATFEVYASMKFTGPQYVNDSTLENALAVDYILFVLKSEK